MSYPRVTEADRVAFERDGYVLKRAFFDAEEVALLSRAIAADPAIVQNVSDHSRTVLLCCYNRVSNNPYKEHDHPRVTPLHKVDDGAIRERGLTPSGERRVFCHAQDDQTITTTTG